ncbi:hypothetical protein BX616_003964 [Lobosporangium transversale]|nr:hypothetical protein BX616_003964 [Lobosporangium transversale]
MVANPDHFVASSYLRYLSWALSDKTAAVRLEALKVLTRLFEMENQPHPLRQFTTRSTARFIEMAIGESDTSARLGAIRVLTLVHKHGQLDEEEQFQLSGLIFGANQKVRKSLAKFVKARVWEDEVETRMASCQLLASSSQGDGDADAVVIKKDKVELKSLVSFLIKVGKAQDEQNGHSGQSDDHQQPSGAGTRLFDETKVGRIALAVEALWSEIDVLKNWKSIAEYLIEDHTKSSTTLSQRSGKGKPTSLEDIYHLDEEEENTLLEIFIASLQLILQPPAVPGFLKNKAKIKEQQEDLASEVGRYCIEILPKLFLKYSVDPGRIRFVLVIPQLIPLNVYVDMRLLTDYEELVDDVIKAFKKHSDPSVLSTAAVTLRTMQGYEILRTSHEARIDALGASIVNTFLTLVSQGENVDITDRAMLEELTLCLRRLEHLIKCTDVTVRRARSTDQDPFGALLKVIERYKTAHDQDAEVLVSALSIAFLWISWVCRANAIKRGQNADWSEEDTQDMLHKQDTLVRLVSDLAIKENQTQTIDARVRRRAFQVLGDIYWLFGGDMFHSSKGANRHLLYMSCPEATQAECENFLRTELDLWDEKVRQKATALQQARTPRTTDGAVKGGAATAAEGGEEEEDGQEAQDIAELVEEEKLAAAQIEQEDKYEMFGTVFSFMRQIMLKDFSMGHAIPILAWYGRFGTEYDEGVKRVVASIKGQIFEGLSKQAREEKAQSFMTVCLESLKESFELYLNNRVRSTSQSLQLAKALSTAIKPPGFMQSSRTGIESRLVWDLHKRGIVYALEKIERFSSSATNGADGAKKSISKMVQFFDVLSHMPFGPHTALNETTSIYDLIKSECERRELNVTEEEGEDLWEPLHSYQLKIEKMMQRAAAEQATAARKAENTARQQHDEQQEQEHQPQPDVEMDNAAEERESIEQQQPEKMSGKKRLAEDEDIDLHDEDELDRENGTHGRPSHVGSPSGGDDSDHESHATKETKRIRVI